YQREGFDMFNAMMDGIKEESVGNLFNRQFEIQENPIVEEVGAGAQLGFDGALPGVTAGQAPAAAAAAAAPAAPAAPRRRQPPAPPSVPEPVAPPAAFGRRAAGSQPRSGQPDQQQDGQPAGGRARGRHAANDGRGHATAAGRGEAATRSGGTHAAGAPETFGPDATEPSETARPVAAHAAGPQVVAPAGLEPRRPRQLQYSAPSDGGGVETHGDASLDPYATVGRNDMCPCGSGRKFKRCHGGAGRS
ncbi:MAG TPA: SEC-C metal-binding domain-containing protein, partial [Trebonia sp.]|nr:SEC-C metal-binding domain-containing protein [Trebonia sp.]